MQATTASRCSERQGDPRNGCCPKWERVNCISFAFAPGIRRGNLALTPGQVFLREGTSERGVLWFAHYSPYPVPFRSCSSHSGMGNRLWFTYFEKV